MARDREQEEGQATTGDAATSAPSSRGRLGQPLIVAATFAAGAGAALAARSILESRRKGGAQAPELGADTASGEDLASTLRRAALDVAIAATNEAAERLSVGEESEARKHEPALQQS